MTSASTPLFGALFLVLAMPLSAAGSFLSRRWIRSWAKEGHNDVAGFIFGAVGVIYAVLLAFVVFAVWDRQTKADDAVATEAAAIVSVYRDTQILPEPQRQDAQAALVSYVSSVPKEWHSHGTLTAHSAPDPLNKVWNAFRSVKPQSTLGEQQLIAAEGDLHLLEVQRHQRHLSEEASLPLIFWPVLIGGSLVMIAFALMLSIENTLMHAAMTALLAGCAAAILFLIFGLQHPYTGLVQVSPQPFEHALLQFHALDNGSAIEPI